jgi:hypothetical protein
MWALILLLCAPVASGQTPSKFEVASAKLSMDGPEAPFSIESPGGTRFRAHNITVWNLIR